MPETISSCGEWSWIFCQSKMNFRKADKRRMKERAVTYGTCGQDDFSRGRDGILDPTCIDKDAGSGLGVIQENLLHQRRLIKVQVGRLTQGLAQEGSLGRGPGLVGRID